MRKKTNETPQEILKRLSSREEGVTIKELAKACGSHTLGPYSRTIEKGERDGVIKNSQWTRDGYPVYKGCSIIAQVHPAKPEPRIIKSPAPLTTEQVLGVPPEQIKAKKKPKSVTPQWIKEDILVTREKKAANECPCCVEKDKKIAALLRTVADLLE